MDAAAVYVRISSDRSGQRAGVERQRTDCLSWAEDHGATVAEVYEDNDTSAFRGKSRVAYSRMLDDIRAGYRDGIIAWHPDRLSRNIRETEDLVDLIEETGAEVATVTGGSYDLSTGAGRGMIRVAAVFARMESEDKSRRLRRKAEEIAAAGRPSGGGVRAYGYDADRTTVVPAEAAVIKEAAARALSGDSLTTICRDLHGRGVPTVTGAGWSPTMLRRLLTAPRIAGQRDYRGAVIADATWPAILPPETVRRLRSKLLRSDATARRRPRIYALSGLVVCGNCGTRMVAHKRLRFLCSSTPTYGGCGTRSIAYGPMEEVVTGHVLEWARLSGVRQSTLEIESPDSLRSELELSYERLDELATMWANHEITPREWEVARRVLERRIDEGERELARLAAAADAAAIPPGAQDWERLSTDRRHAIFSALIECVRVGPSIRGRNIFDPHRVEVVWRERQEPLHLAQ